eukprot:TRINITY_DN30087_c0_g3_i1.p1 TRINITY_DN30087_c0_g3~~TRINITY_DN30087_c0_g3_i1.p1  ORF type:complete len:502 (-),score=65.79 TRINITY_DN30087_c0_g3_i1:205-1710(-)
MVIKRPRAASPTLSNSRTACRLKQCATISQELRKSTTLPGPVKVMLQGAIAASLGVPRSERHPFQEKVVDMIAQALADIEISLQSAIESPEAEVVIVREEMVALRSEAAAAEHFVSKQTEKASKTKAKKLSDKMSQLERKYMLARNALELFREQTLLVFDELHGAPCKIDANRCGQPSGCSDYTWIRRSNNEPERRSRREIAALTRRVVRCGGYALENGREVRLRYVDSMIDGTRIVSPTCGMWPQTLTFQRHDACKRPNVVHGTVLETASRLVQEGYRVVAVSAASAYHCGGGFLTGGRHALEEAFCVQSTLHSSLNHAAKLAGGGFALPTWAHPLKKHDGSNWHMHIPGDGVILSPCVEVFREGTDEGYPFGESTTVLEAVVSVGMPNRNENMSDSPVDANPDVDAYFLQLQQKWRAVLTAAACYTTANCLVVPDAGCGVFRNSPSLAGKALGSVLRSEFAGRFDEVCIAFPGGQLGDEFGQASICWSATGQTDGIDSS